MGQSQILGIRRRFLELEEMRFYGFWFGFAKGEKQKGQACSMIHAKGTIKGRRLHMLK